VAQVGKEGEKEQPATHSPFPLEMCGIGALLLGSHPTSTSTSPLASVAAALASRGPDFSSSFAPHPSLALVASVLSLRGVSPCPQPAIDCDGNVLCWNGEVFGGEEGLPTGGDTPFVLRLLARAADSAPPDDDEDDDSPTATALAAALLRAVVGPYAFLFYHARTQTLLFGRDPVGRRSLLVHGLSLLPLNPDPPPSPPPPPPSSSLIVISSVAAPLPGVSSSSPLHELYEELPPLGVYSLVLPAPSAAATEPWTPLLRLARWGPSFSSSVFPPTRPRLPSPGAAFPVLDDAALARGALALLTRLSAAVRVRVLPETTPLPSPPPPSPSPPPPTSLFQWRAEGDASAPPPTVPEALHRLAAAGFSERDLPAGSPSSPSPSRVALLFSGGLDCMVLAALVHTHLPPHEPLDLINVCFSPDHASPDRVGARAGVAELRRVFPTRAFRLLLVDDTFADTCSRGPALLGLIAPARTHLDFNIAAALWSSARGVGFVEDEAVTGMEADVVSAVPGGAAAGRASAATHLHAGTSAKLRYGLDAGVVVPDGKMSLSVFNGRSTDPSDDGVVLPFDGLRGHYATAAEVEDAVAGALPAYDGPGARDAMLAVQSEDVRVICAAYDDVFTSASAADGYAAPPTPPSPAPAAVVCSGTRKGKPCRALSAAACSRGLCKFCCVAAAQAGGPVPPSPSCRLHAPAAASGAAADSSSSPSPSSSPPSALVAPARTLVRTRAKVLLTGLGADELMAGYGRHRTAFRVGGGSWEGLAAELREDTARLWRRNLGRDDRVLSSHGREARYPYLDEGVVALLAQLPLPLVTDPRLPHGVGDKRLLRGAAALLGLRECACLVKRAMHFGSRIAKQSNAAAFGGNSKANGDALVDGLVGLGLVQGGGGEE
jgi:asparagine synthetase B (glutamine-hydrolysing)